MAFTGPGKAAASGAVIIGRHQKRRCRIDRLAVKGKLMNSRRASIDQLAVVVITRGLRHIDLIINAIDHIKIVGTEIPVNQRLRLSACGIDLIKLPG